MRPEKAFRWQILFLLIGFGIIPSAIAYTVYYGGLSRIAETTKAPVLASLETVVAAGIGLLAFGQKLSPVKILGIILVLCSIAVMNANKHAAKNAKLRSSCVAASPI